MSDFENRIRRQIYNRVDALGGIDEEELCGLLDSVMLEDEYAAFPVKKKLELRRDIFTTVIRLDILQNLIDDDSVTEIMVNGYRDIFFEREVNFE